MCVNQTYIFIDKKKSLALQMFKPPGITTDKNIDKSILG